jgi:hypothetical protein
MEQYTMGFNAGLECAASLLDLGERGALRRGVTLAELAEHIRTIKVAETETHNQIS